MHQLNPKCALKNGSILENRSKISGRNAVHRQRIIIKYSKTNLKVRAKSIYHNEYKLSLS